MKALTCEMCGSTNLIKTDGVFVCQSCGTKYSVEEAKKMMVEGTVEVKGTVKVDTSSELQNLISLTKTSIEGDNGEEAYSYANRCLELNSRSAEAWLLKMKAAGLLAILKDLKVQEIITSGRKAIEFSDGSLKKEVYSYYLERMNLGLIFLSSQLFDTHDIKQLFDAHLQVNFLTAGKETLQSDVVFALVLEQAETLMNLRREISDEFISANTDIHEDVKVAAQGWVSLTKAAQERMKVFSLSLSDEYVNKYRGYLIETRGGLPADATEPDPSTQIQQDNGCYVATAVYGSYDCPEVWTLRRFRDYSLAETWYGRVFVHIYYAISPTLVKWFGHTNWFKKMWKEPLDSLVKKLQSKGFENTPYNDRVW